MKYCLTHSCGRSYPVEPRQAGQQIDCACGEKIQVPTMLKIKKLPEWVDEQTGENESTTSEEDELAKNASSRTKQTQEAASDAPRTQKNSPKVKGEGKRLPISQKRLGLFVVASLFFIVSVFFLCRTMHKPVPLSVYWRQTQYREGGRNIKRDSTQTTQMDNGFYFTWDETGKAYIVTDEMIDKGFNYFGAYQYFQYVRDLEMSDNFNENYNSILTSWKLRLGGLSIVAFVSLLCALLALFVKESTKQVGAMRGDVWR